MFIAEDVSDTFIIALKETTGSSRIYWLWAKLGTNSWLELLKWNCNHIFGYLDNLSIIVKDTQIIYLKQICQIYSLIQSLEKNHPTEIVVLLLEKAFFHFPALNDSCKMIDDVNDCR